MAEPDAAGHGPADSERPKRRIRYTLADAQRSALRATATLRAAAAEAERAMAPFRAAAAEVERATAGPRAAMRDALGEDVEPEPEPETTPQRPPTTPKPNPPAPSPDGPPLFEATPTKSLLVTLREAFPGFTPTSGWWSAVERELKNCHHRSNPAGHDAFCAAYVKWSAEDLIRHLEAEGRVKRPRKPRGPTVCERLRDLHATETDFAETASVRELAKRIGKAPATLNGSHYYQAKLKPRRAEVAAQKKTVKRAQRWGNFDSLGHRDTPSPSQHDLEGH